MNNRELKEIPNPLQKIILTQVVNDRDDDGWCRLLNSELAHLASDVTVARFRKELAPLVKEGYLIREIGPQEGQWTQRRLRVSPKVQGVRT